MSRVFGVRIFGMFGLVGIGIKGLVFIIVVISVIRVESISCVRRVGLMLVRMEFRMRLAIFIMRFYVFFV